MLKSFFRVHTFCPMWTFWLDFHFHFASLWFRNSSPDYSKKKNRDILRVISKRISWILESLWMILIVYTLVYVSDCQCVELSSRLHIARSSISQQCPQRVQCLTLRYHIIRLTFTDIIGTSREVNAKRFYVLVNKEADKTFL